MSENIIELYTSVSELEQQEKMLQNRIDKALQSHDYSLLISYEPLIKLVRERLSMLKQT